MTETTSERKYLFVKVSDVSFHHGGGSRVGQNKSPHGGPEGRKEAILKFLCLFPFSFSCLNT